MKHCDLIIAELEIVVDELKEFPTHEKILDIIKDLEEVIRQLDEIARHQ